jgi:hypothetical protein
MPNDCGCDKKNDYDSKKEKRNQIWVYKKTCAVNPNLPINSYVGKTGFAYYLVNKDTKESTEIKVDYNFSNLIPGEIVYYVRLYKVVKTKINKKKNTIKKYLECFTHYSYITKLEQSRIIDIINNIENNKYDLIPHDTNEFKNYVIQNILKTNKSSKNKNTTNSLTIYSTIVEKSYGDISCTNPPICPGNSLPGISPGAGTAPPS